MEARLAYLETQIATAAPQQLRLMLIEGALRLARQTANAWHEDRPEEALETLIRCRSIITELIAGIRAGSSRLADQVVGIYLFLFQELTQAQLRRDASRLEGVIRVLEEERTTWQQLCAAAGSSPLPSTAERISLDA
ncbi:MAG: flagellar export chaperone FliS [Pirellulaceae bacterium]